MYEMSPWFYYVCMTCLAAMIVSGVMVLYRLRIGPAASDRAIALDCLATCFMGIICILSIVWQSILFFDAVWLLTLVGFMGSAAVARYLEKGRVF